jgi:DNA-binding MarR family transcriptional regulator
MAKGKSKVRSYDRVEVADRLHSLAIHLLRRLRINDLASGIGPAQLSALSVLVFGGARSLGELAEAERVKPPTMSRIVAGLEKSGLIQRHSTGDKRRMRLEPTARGVRLLQEGRKRRVESLAEAMRSLSDAEVDRLQELINVLQRVLPKL